MPDFINTEIVKDSSIDSDKKFKCTVYLKRGCYAKWIALLILLAALREMMQSKKLLIFILDTLLLN
ncbi:hypothetical protein CAGA_08200 [Caproiciproducens galactitolivorans]|uniref:Uncharacterized protein n=1 Tax=Caproiciproducens galactitolivorans TaxID=642589 RepID=A0A4Z0YEV9_9FIRM|nr:hypothetical protein CAGA_08200 [Caproiciproducens galactitolivorans]